MKHPRPGFLDRRGLLAGLATIAALPAQAAIVLDEATAPFTTSGIPDAPILKKLRPWQVDVLSEIGDTIRRKLYAYPVECSMMDDHYRVRLPWDVLFRGPARTALTPDGVTVATKVSEAMVGKRRWKMEINGHAAGLPDGYDAFVVSARQAEAFRAAMVSRTVPGHLLRATGLGDNFPVQPHYRENTRIELLVELA